MQGKIGLATEPPDAAAEPALHAVAAEEPRPDGDRAAAADQQARRHVWIVNQYAGTPRHGIYYRHYHLAHALMRRGHRVTIVSGSYSHLLQEPPEVSGARTVEEIDGIRYCWLRLPRYQGSGAARLRNMLTFMARLFSPRLAELGRPDVVLVSSPSPFAIVPGAIWARRYRAQLIFEVRDIWPMTLVALGMTSARHPIIGVMQVIENFAYRVSDRVVSLLPSALAHMSRHGLAEHKFAYVPNGVDMGLFERPDPLDEDVAARIPRDKFVVGYAGSIGPANALDALVDAADLLRSRDDVHFVVAGMGRERERLEQRVRELALPNLTFVEPVPGRQVPNLLERCDALYVGLQSTPLYHFGVSPNKLFEYMYSGKPVISAIDADRDIVADAGCGLSVPPDDAQAAADAVVQIAATPEPERRAMGVRGRTYIAEHHSYDALAARYCDLLADDEATSVAATNQ